MNADAIVKALKCCNVPSGRACSECPYHEVGAECRTQRNKDAVTLILELAEESYKWQEAYGCADSACRELSSKCDELTEENERLKKANGLFEYLNEAVHWVEIGGKMEYVEIKSIPQAINEQIDKLVNIQNCRAETVRKMQERLKAKAEIVSTYGNPTMVDVDYINQIAKEMLED
jgi:hypothetical protein